MDERREKFGQLNAVGSTSKTKPVVSDHGNGLAENALIFLPFQGGQIIRLIAMRVEQQITTATFK